MISWKNDVLVKKRMTYNKNPRKDSGDVNYLDSFENIKETTARPPQIKHQADQNTRSA